MAITCRCEECTGARVPGESQIAYDIFMRQRAAEEYGRMTASVADVSRVHPAIKSLDGNNPVRYDRSDVLEALANKNVVIRPGKNALSADMRELSQFDKKMLGGVRFFHKHKYESVDFTQQMKDAVKEPCAACGELLCTPECEGVPYEPMIGMLDIVDDVLGTPHKIYRDGEEITEKAKEHLRLAHCSYCTKASFMVDHGWVRKTLDGADWELRDHAPGEYVVVCDPCMKKPFGNFRMSVHPEQAVLPGYDAQRVLDSPMKLRPPPAPGSAAEDYKMYTGGIYIGKAPPINRCDCGRRVAQKYERCEGCKKEFRMTSEGQPLIPISMLGSVIGIIKPTPPNEYGPYGAEKDEVP